MNLTNSNSEQLFKNDHNHNYRIASENRRVQICKLYESTSSVQNTF